MATKSRALVEAETEMLESSKQAFIERMKERIACKTESQRRAYLKDKQK